MKEDKIPYNELLAENTMLKKRLSDAEKEINNSKLLNKSEQFLKSIFNSSPTAMIICEAPDGKITYINDAVWDFRGETDSRMTGITIEEYIMTWKEFYPDGRQYTGIEMPLARSLLNGEIVKNEQLIVQLEDGTEKWAAAWSTPIYDSSKNIIAAIVLFYDITEHKIMENALIESEKHLKNLNATKDKFFSIIAHDLKSPFNSILGFSNLIETNIKNKNYSKVDEFVNIIQQVSNKTIDLLHNLVEWSKSQTNMLEYKPEYIDLTKLVNEILELMKYSAEQKSIDISLIIPKQISIYADNSMVGTIIRNMISNAIKFTNSGGKIIISAKNNTSECLISVSDNGVGIKKESINKLFKIEESISTTGTENEIGTGLGLILCKEFVDKHSGTIWVESEYGEGSKFNVVLPIIENYKI